MALNNIREFRLIDNQQSHNRDQMVVGQEGGHTTVSPNSATHSNSYAKAKESGRVEKLMHSYGFIHYSDSLRIFFHFSEFRGDASTLAVGDPVDFVTSWDGRSSRPIALNVSPSLPPPFVPSCTVSNEQMTGLVLVEPKSTELAHSIDRSGRISYEQGGECFFIAYSTLDLADEDDGAAGEGGCGAAVQPKQADSVTFYVATDNQKGNVWATCVQKVPPAVKTYQGVICSLKENFGFIERSDVVKEIFFHYTEYAENIAELSLGDDVEYTIQTRNGKEVASNVRRLPVGTVVFEDVNDKQLRGKIQKVIKPTKKPGDPLGGCIVYETLDGSKEIPYGDRDVLGEFTTFPGDVVQFNVAIDRRDGLQRATNIKILLDDSILVSKEKRDRGTVTSLKETFGFLQMCGTGEQLFFHFSELIDLGGARVSAHDELEFTVAHDPANKSKPIAIRMKRIQRSSSDAQSTVSSQTFLGVVAAAGTMNGGRGSLGASRKPAADGSPYVVRYTYNDKELSIPLVMKANEFRIGEKVFFNISERRSDGSCRVVNAKSASGVDTYVGYVIILKDNYGFIETLTLDDEIFFHFTHYQGDKNDIEIGAAVEYILVTRNKKIYAECVRKLRNVSVMDIQEGTPMVGKVMRTVRTGISVQENYSGLIQVEAAGQGEPAMTYPFGIMSIMSQQNKRSIPVVGDMVQFQLAKVKATGDLRAACVQQLKELLIGKVEIVKGQQIVIEYDDGKKVTCHQPPATVGSSADASPALQLQPGDVVEFYLTASNGLKPVAFGVRRSQSTARPERLISRLKQSQQAADTRPRLVVVRQPRGPDGTRGFNGAAARAAQGAKQMPPAPADLD